MPGFSQRLPVWTCTDSLDPWDSQRMGDINKEIGLDAALAGIGMGGTASDDEKASSGSDDGKSGGNGETREIEVVG